jgi:hypothetical protein
MSSNKVQHLKPGSRSHDDTAAEDRARLEMYQAFMVGYVRRINEASFNVTIGGVRIGSAKYSRLAQINLQSRIITFSRFAVENVPERGRRYLVLHELAHVKEASHNKHFWGWVERYESDYKKVSRELETAFKNNVREEHQRLKKMSFSNSLNRPSLKEPRSQHGNRLLNYKLDAPVINATNPSAADGSVIIKPFQSGTSDSHNFDCMEEEFSLWDFDESDGIVNGGSDFDADDEQNAESSSPLITASGAGEALLQGNDCLQLKLPFG